MRAWLLLLLLLPIPLLAIEAGEALDNPKLEARAMALGETLRCVVCAGESVNDSRAVMARNMRKLVREKIVAGATDQEIRDYLAARYGDAILFKPPLKGTTWPLYVGPWAFLALACGGYWLWLKRRKARL